MGLFSFFSSSPSQKAVQAQVNKAKERYAQNDYRQAAMEKLLKWNTKESLEGVLERFCVVVQSPHWDEEEKRWLAEKFIEKGEEIKDIVENFILKKDEISQCLVVLKTVLNDNQKFQEFLLKALNKRGPEDYLLVRSKKEIIQALSELNDRSVEELILPYLDDHSDDVQCGAIGFLIQSHNEDIINKLKAMLSSEQHSPRVLRNLATLIYEQKIPVGQVELAPAVKEDFLLKNGNLAKVKS